ncbi:MAG: GTPase HflX [Rhodospirillales bacterium RIFCSPLOWO2_12_FULL_58_28]|nr:MAG: GTPase HflX [Rhodospirillales bacterium RIFCSPLOWO2_02_FULL_58_16]OHC78824.1 MAG: GTPase HflX [Rhodospirillales bacterium RIFCSPLOWO2_12_FULL_58_28]
MHPYFQADGEPREPSARLEEAVGLARAINLKVIHAEALRLVKANPATLLGKGAVERIAALIRAADCEEEEGAKEETKASVTVVDATLTPGQQRNLERAWNSKVLDRTGLILEIFGARARTSEGRLQVELALLTYQRSRLVRSWTHLERQRGGAGFMGGPGETQIESDRRQIDQRIINIKRRIKEVKRTRRLHRQARQRLSWPAVSLVGYTNSGKSTLFNTLTNAGVEAADQLFATLDPTMRSLRLPSGRTVILSDTVGFISDLPHELVDAFHATLEEVSAADLIVHVRDASHPDAQAQKQDVETVLGKLGLEKAGNLIEAINKIDLLTPDDKESLINRAGRESAPPRTALSALTGEGCENLLKVIDKRLSDSFLEVEVSIAITNGAALSWLYQHAEVLERIDGEDAIRLKVRMDAVTKARFERM